MNKVLFPTNPPQDQTRFPSPVTAREILSLSLAGLPPTVSTVGYTTVKHTGVSVVLRTFQPCVNIGRNFFAPPRDKLGAAANRETVLKKIWMKSLGTGVHNFYIVSPFVFSKFHYSQNIRS